MTHADYAKAICEGAAALAALVAAFYWLAAARQPVALYAPIRHDGGASNLPINKNIQRGAKLNAAAATWAAVSALFQGLALLIGIASPIAAKDVSLPNATAANYFSQPNPFAITPSMTAAKPIYRSTAHTFADAMDSEIW
jgi:hypothetical protein